MAVQELQISSFGYTTVITGNGGENQMIITCNGDQSGRVGARISTVSIDAARKEDFPSEVVLFETNDNDWNYLYKKLHEALLLSIEKWLCTGVAPNEALLQKDLHIVRMHFKMK
jgi:hypothetical protein